MKHLPVILLLALLATACRDVPVIDVASPKTDSLEENNMNANRYISQGEESQINAYVERRGWQMRRLNGGTRVMETKGGDAFGRKIDYEDTVVINYDIEAISGAVVYSNLTDTVVAGRLQPTRGLDVALRTLSRGSEAVVIVPSEQAYGVVGDGDRISTRMILIYRLKVN